MKTRELKTVKGMPRPFSLVKRASHRNEHGSGVIVLVVICMAALLSCLVLPGIDCAMAALSYRRADSAIEAASLAASADLSKIVINDKYWGFVALTDDAPVGQATLASDSQPMPVWGINTIWATCRNELLVAQLLDNNFLQSCAQRDILEAKRVTKDLSDILHDSLRSSHRYRAVDKDGNLVKPFEHAQSILLSNVNGLGLTGSIKVSDFNLSIGWLNEPADSLTSAPMPLTISKVPTKLLFGTNFRAFVDAPIGSQSFFFAGFGRQGCLVNKANFKPDDGKRICSVVKAQCVISTSLRSQLSGLAGMKEVSFVTSACSEPRNGVDSTIPGILRISFANGLVPSIQKLRDLFTDYYLNQTKTDILTACGGDYPLDPHTQLALADPSDKNRSMSEIFARGFFDWLRSTHNKARLDAVLQVVDAPFAGLTATAARLDSTPVFLYEFDKQGRLLVSNETNSAFLNESIDENQTYAINFSGIKDGDNYWTVTVRDQVHNLGTANGGKHGGETMTANPINWCELAYYGGTSETAALKQKGSAARGLIAEGSSENCPAGSGAIVTDTAVFRSSSSGMLLSQQPRKNFYSGGLAVEFKISAPTPIDQFCPTDPQG